MLRFLITASEIGTDKLLYFQYSTAPAWRDDSELGDNVEYITSLDGLRKSLDFIEQYSNIHKIKIHKVDDLFHAYDFNAEFIKDYDGLKYKDLLIK